MYNLRNNRNKIFASVQYCCMNKNINKKIRLV